MNLSNEIASKITIHGKYARYLPEQQRRETWDEIVNRCADMHVRKYPYLEGSIREAFECVRDKKVLPSMRSLQFGGRAIELSNSRLYNCFGRETRFITYEGVKSFEDFNDGDICFVRSHTGAWRKATVKNYGQQTLHNLTFNRMRSKKTVRATTNHSWILKDGSRTESLKIGDSLLNTVDVYGKFDYDNATVPERLYWAYGYIFGDGTRVKDGSGKHTYSMVRLCGKDVKFLPRFEELGFKSSTTLSLKGDVVVFSGKYLKTSPDLDKDSPDLVRAFVTGYLDADGKKNYNKTKHTKGTSPYTRIVTTQNFDFIEKAFEMVGVYITNVVDLTGQKTNYKVRGKTKEYALTSNLGKAAHNHWHLVNDVIDKTEDVWCLEVEHDHSFTLSGGLVTGNCGYMSASYSKFFSELMFLLLGGSGIGYSVQNRHISHLPVIHKPSKERKFLVQDSIVGWADAVKVLISAFMEGKYLPRFDFSDIRAKGTPLKTAGGKAPGSGPLRICLARLQAVLESKEVGSRLLSHEVSDMACIIADAVLAGGIRRSAMICLFDMDEECMLAYKSGEWYNTYPYRARVNISTTAVRGDVSKEQFDKFWGFVKASGSGEPGIYWTNDPELGTNPCCLTGDTRLLNEHGYLTMKEMAFSGKAKLFNSDNILVNAKIWSNGIKDTIKLLMSDGSIIKCTPDHRIGILGLGEQQAQFTKGARLTPFFRINSAVTDYVRMGFIQGDGGLGRLISDSHLGIEVHIGKKDQDIAKMFGFDEVGTKYIKGWKEKFKAIEADPSPLPTRKLPAKLRSLETIEQAEFLKGLFSANGCVIKNARVALKATCKELIQEVHDILMSEFAINSYITTNKAKKVTFKNGEYLCKESYDLNIGRYHDLKMFSWFIGFVHKYKQDALAELITAKAPVVMSISNNGKEEVFDFALEGYNHWGITCDLLVHNCEIALKDKQFCNLTTINYTDVTSQEDLNNRVWAASLIGTLQASYTDFHYLSHEWGENCREEALLGLSITGIADGGHYRKFDWKEAAEVAKSTNLEWASLLGINPAARITCIKPEGTASLVLGSSSGIHARHAHYYIRRQRLGKDEPISRYLEANHPELLAQDVTKPDGWVLEIPQKSPDRSIYRSEDVLDFLGRVKYFHEEWVLPGHISGPNTHNISATIPIKTDEWDLVGKWMWDNKDHYNGLSVLPEDGRVYQQLPFEDCSKEEYERRMTMLKDIDLTKVIEEEDNTAHTAENIACAGGACLI